MLSSLLQTKLYIPSLSPKLVPRPRLLARLNDGLHRKLTLVAAPAGSGKTTLISDWLRQIDQPAAWLSLDQADNDLTRFWIYFIAALQTVQPDVGQMALAGLESIGFGNTDTVSHLEKLHISLLNDLAALPEQLVLVLDDYHLIETPEIHHSFTFFLDNLPPSLHLMLITREDPLLPLTQLRVKQQMIEIRAIDLYFTAQEVSQFFQQTMGLELKERDILVLEQRTEGWVAGLQMAALSMQQVPDVTAFVEAFAGDDRYVVDYLITEVLERQPEQVQTFLLQTSILQRLTVSLCDTITEGENSHEILAHLEEANLFLIALDNRREWYRYHHLFADLLRYQLKELMDPEQVNQLHQRAADWYAHNNLPDEAIYHYIAALSFDSAAALIERIGLGLIMRGQLRQALNWLEALPADFVQTRPRLCLCHAWALTLTGQTAAVKPRLQAIEQAMPVVTTAYDRDVRGQIHTIRAILVSRQDNVPLSLEYLRKALADLAQDNHLVHSAAHLSLGYKYLALGQYALADREFQIAQTEGHVAQAIYVVLVAMRHQADIYLAQGKLRRAAQLYQEAITYGLAQNQGHPFPPAGYSYAGLGQILYEQNDLSQAEQLLTQAIELGKLMAERHIIRLALIPLLWLKQVTGDSAAIPALWQEAQTVLQQLDDRAYGAHLAAFQARLQLTQAMLFPPQHPSALPSAVNWAENYQASQPDPTDHQETFAQTTLAWVELVQNKVDQALSRLTSLAKLAEAGGHIDNLIKILALQVLAYAAQDDLDAALDILSQALNLAAPEGYIRSFVDFGPPMKQLLQRAASHQIAPEYVSMLLSAFPTPPSYPHSAAPSPLIEPLSERELQVLRLLANGLSNQEIAGALIVSINTVRTHLRRIYAKLAVNNRTAAVSRAQELEIL